MENNKVICTQCGKELKITDKFCISCGTKNESFSQEVVKEVKSVKKNKKLFIGVGIAVAVILAIVLIAPTLYALVSPTGYVKSAISNTFESFEKDNKKFNEVPTFSSLFADSKSNSQKELYLKIEDINAATIPLDTTILKDYGVKFIVQSKKDNSAGKLNLALMEGENGIVDGSIYFDKEKIALEAPKLFKDVLGIRIEENKDDIVKENDELDDLNTTINMFSELVESSKQLEEIYVDLASKYANKLIDLAEFKKDKSVKNLYTATIDGEDVVLIITDFITELFNNEDFKDYLATSMYLSEGYDSKEYYVDMVENMAIALPDEIDYMLEEVEVGDLVIDVVVEKKTMISLDASLSVTSYDETLKIKYAMEYNDEKDNRGIDFSLKFGVSSYDTIEGSLSYIKDGKDLKRNISLDFNVSELDGIMSFDFVETLKDNKKYENSLTCNINDGYEDVKIIFDTIGSFKTNERIDYENIGLTVSVDDEKFTFNFSGYAANTKIKSVDTIDGKKVIYLEDLDEQDFNELYNEFNENLFKLMRSFGGSI